MDKSEIPQPEASSGQGGVQPDPGKYLFVLRPCGRDFYRLAQHIAAAPPERLHAALWPQRGQVAQHLRQIGEEIGEKEAESEEHQSAYHALRLLIW